MLRSPVSLNAPTLQPRLESRVGACIRRWAALGKAAAFAYIRDMSSSSRLTTEDVRRVEETVRKHPLPPFVTGFDVEYGDDHDGDPALWVLFKLKEGGIPITPRLEEIEPQIDEMNRLVSVVRSDLLDLLPDRWPYFRFVPSRPDAGSPHPS